MVPFFRVILIFSLPFGASRKSSNLSKRMKISHTWPSHSLHAKWRNPWIFRPPCVFFWQPWDNLKCLLPDFVQVMLVFRQGTNDRLTETFGQVVGAKIYLETFLLPVLGASVDINQWIPENSAVFGSALRRPHAVFSKPKYQGGMGWEWWGNSWKHVWGPRLGKYLGNLSWDDPGNLLYCPNEVWKEQSSNDI